MAQSGNTTIGITTTQVFDAGSVTFNNMVLTNVGAVDIWVALNGEAAVANQGIRVAAGEQLPPLNQYNNFHPIVNAISLVSPADLAWQRS